jgi:hypothetical protein
MSMIFIHVVINIYFYHPHVFVDFHRIHRLLMLIVLLVNKHERISFGIRFMEVFICQNDYQIRKILILNLNFFP